MDGAHVVLVAAGGPEDGRGSQRESLWEATESTSCSPVETETPIEREVDNPVAVQPTFPSPVPSPLESGTDGQSIEGGLRSGNSCSTH